MCFLSRRWIWTFRSFREQKKKTDIDSNCKLSRNIDQYVHKCLLLSSNVQVDLKEKKSECENIQLIGAKWRKSCAHDLSLSNFQGTLLRKKKISDSFDGNCESESVKKRNRTSMSADTCPYSLIFWWFTRQII